MDPTNLDHLFECCSVILKFCSVNAQDTFQNVMLSADGQFITDHIYANATLMSFLDPQMSRCVMWKEILSGVIESHVLNDYRAVNRLNNAITAARNAVAANQNDDFLFRQHNTANTTVLAQIDAFLQVGANVDNPIVKIRMLAEKLLGVIEYIEGKHEYLSNVVDTYETLRESVSNIESLSNRIIKREVTYDNAIKTLMENDDLVAKLMAYHNTFVSTEPFAQDMEIFLATIPGGLDNTNPTIGRMKTWVDENNFLSYCRVRTPPRELSEIQAYRALANRNSNMYTNLFPYRSMNDGTGDPFVRPVTPVVESSTGRDSRRSSVGSRHEKQDLTDRKINRFIRNVKDIRLRLTDEMIEDKSEAVIESLKNETVELEKKFNNILDYCDDEQEVRIINIQFGGKNYNTDSVLREWKTDLDDAINEKKLKAKEDQYSRKAKEDNAKSILNSNPIVKLEKDSDYLDFVESVKQVTAQMSESTSDILIASAIKKALVRDKDKKEVKCLTRTKEIIDVLSRNYAANKSLIAKIISPIINLPDPTSYYKSLENCKEIIAFLKRMKDNELDEHLQETHLANFESRAFYSVRRQMYCSELAKFTAGILPDCDEEDSEVIPEPRGTSTPTSDGDVSIRIIRKKNTEVEKLNSSAVDILNLQDKMKRNLSKLAIGKKLKFFKDYIKKTELFFLNEMICSLELNNSNNPKRENPNFNKNGRSVTINKTDFSLDKSGRGSNNNTGKKRSFEERMNDPALQKPCPTGCGSKHYNGSARFCKVFYELPLEERCDTSKKKKLCGKCLCGCFKGGHKGPNDCTMEITCRKCGSKNHNTLLCRKTPELQAFTTETKESEVDEEEDLDAYYAQLGLEDGPNEDQSINHIQEDDDLVGIIKSEDRIDITNNYVEASELEFTEEEFNNYYVEIIDEELGVDEPLTKLECNLIEISDADNDDSEFQFFLNQTYSEDMSAIDHSNYFLHHQAKIASEIFQVKWSKMITVIKSRIINRVQNDAKVARYIIKECRDNGIIKSNIQDARYSMEEQGNISDDELKKVGSSLVMEFIHGIKLQPKKLQTLGQCLDLHATASKNWTQEEWHEITNNKADIENRFGSLLIEDEIDKVPYDSQESNKVIEVNKTDVSTNHFIPVKEWQRNTQLEPPTPKDDVILFDVEKPDGSRGQIEVKYSDLGIKLEDCRLESMPKLEPKSHPSPNENKKNYVHLNKESKGIFQLVYHNLIKQALDLHSKYGLTVKGMYLPVLIKIKDVIRKPEDVEIIKIPKEGTTYARLILCIDSGSETGLLDESVARSFVFDSNAASPINVKINTVVGSKSEKLERQVILFRGTDGIHYPSCSLQIAKIGQDKMQTPEGIEKLCDLFQFDHRTKQHFIKNAGPSNRRCHVLISMKEMGSFFEILEPERLNGVSPCISPNTKIITSVLSDQLIIAGQIGLSYTVANYQTLFVHKDRLGEELSKITNGKVTVKSVGEEARKVPMLKETSNDGVDTPNNNSSWDCHYVRINEKDETYAWKWEQMAQLVSHEEFETDNEMDIHKIAVKTEEEIEFKQLLIEKDDGGVTAILATATEEGTNDLSSADYELLNVIRTKLGNENMTESDLLENFQSMDTHNLLIENDRVIHYSDGPEPVLEEIEPVEELDCCSLQCSEVIKLLHHENELNLKILCDSCRLRECAACNLANSHMTMSDKLRYLECWRSTKLIEKDGEIRCQVDFLYQNDPKIIFKKENSNFEDAKKNIDSNIKKLKRKGKLEDLIDDVNMKIKLGTLTPVNDKEYAWITENLPHHFSKLHIVHNESSDSTPRRIINNTNTSVENHATSLSAQQLCIKNPLQDDFSILAGFCLHPHPLSLDVSKAYLRILVPYETSCLRLFVWYDNPSEMTGLRVFRRTSGDFGDTPMSGSLTLTQRKLLAPACKSSITAAIARTSNFADNYIDALLSWLGWSTTTTDLVETSKLINLPLKPGATCITTDPDVLIKTEIDPNCPTSNLLGITWNLKTDEVTPNDYFSLRGKSMGATIGKKLKDMVNDEIKVSMITRELLARMSMQPYDRLGRMINPIISTLRTFLSRSCEIIPNQNYKDSVSNYDMEFAQLSRDYLCRLIKFNQIKPFPRSTIPTGHVLYGMCFPSDGGKPAYSAYCYTLSEESGREVNIHHDWRIVKDALGVLSVSDSELKILDEPAGTNFYTDRKPEVHDNYNSTFGKPMQSVDVTKGILEERVMKRTKFETKNGIGPLSAREVESIFKEQNNKNDKLVSHILAAKSKTCKRSIPAHEILGRALATELGLSISKTLGRYSLYTLTHITLVFPGDSVCSAMLHSPHIEIKNTLLLGGVRKAEANLRIITEELPNASIWLTWLPGEDNPSDLSSKMVLEPISTINSELYRTGPKQFKSKKGVKQFCYKSYTPVEKWKWIGLPESLTKVNENACKLKELLNTTASDPLRTEETKRFIKSKEEEYVQCKLCILEEIDDSHYKCDDCVENNNPSEDCSILIVTRSKVKKELVNDIPADELKQTATEERNELLQAQKSKGISPVTELVKRTDAMQKTAHIVLGQRKSVSKMKNKAVLRGVSQSHQLKHLDDKPNQKGTAKTTVIPPTLLIPEKSDSDSQLSNDIRDKEKIVIKMNCLDHIECLMPTGYMYFLENPVIEKTVYEKLMNQACSWNVTFSLFHNFVRGVICFKKKIGKFKQIKVDTFAETWRAIVLSSQAHYGAHVTRKTSTTIDSKMLVSDFRLSSEAHEHLFRTRTLPIISGNDSLAPKLIRYSHLTSSLYGQSHANQKATEANSMRGKFGTHIINATAIVRELSYNCYNCNKYREKQTKVRMGDLSVRISNRPRPYQSISIDPLGHVELKPWIDARTSILCYPLLIKCLESSAITVKLMFKNDTRHVIMKLLELESDFAVKIKHISMDFGSNLIIKNINPKGENQHSRHLFDMLESSHTALPQAQMQNCAESGVKIFKAYIKKIFQLTKDGKLAALCADEWAFLFSFICNQINDIPYIVDNEGYLLSPNDLVHFSPMSAVGNFDASSHFKNIQEFLKCAKSHYNILQEIMMETSLQQWEKFQQKEHNKKSGLNIQIQEGTLVGWRNSDNKFNSGVVLKLEGRKATIKDKLGAKHIEFTGNLTLLASIKYSDYKQSLRERYQK